VGEFVLSCSGVISLLKLSLKLGLFFAIFLTNPNKRAGGEGRNRTRLAFHKPLEINYLNHHRYLDAKGFLALCQGELQLTFLNSILLPTDEVCWHFCWHFLTGNNNGFGYSDKLDIGSTRKYRLAHYA
jgi:hypothetical protein